MDIPAPNGFGERGAVVEDLDGDGIEDLAISGWRSQPLIMVVGSSAANHTPHFKQALLIPFPGANNATRGAMAYCRATPRHPALLVHMMASGRTDVFAGWPLQAKASYSTRFTVGAAVCADVDVDGSPELVVAEYNGSEGDRCQASCRFLRDGCRLFISSGFLCFLRIQINFLHTPPVARFA